MERLSPRRPEGGRWRRAVACAAERPPGRGGGSGETPAPLTRAALPGPARRGGVLRLQRGEGRAAEPGFNAPPPSPLPPEVSLGGNVVFVFCPPQNGHRVRTRPSDVWVFRLKTMAKRHSCVSSKTDPRLALFFAYTSLYSG